MKSEGFILPDTTKGIKTTSSERNIFTPPILGTAPWCEVRLLGRTTIFRLLANCNTNGINISPTKNDTAAAK